MPFQSFATRLLRAPYAVAVVLLGLIVFVTSSAGAQQQTTYLLDINGQKVPIDGIAFGGVGNSQPDSGAATLRMRAANGESPLSHLAEAGSQGKLFVQFRDPQSNGIVHYEFDDVRFGRVRQTGQGPAAMESLEITYTSFNVNTPGSFRRASGGGSRVVAARRNVHRSTPRKGVHSHKIKQYKPKPGNLIIR